MPRIKIDPDRKVTAGRLRDAMPGAGRPTEYDDTYPDKVFRLSLLGSSDGEIAAFFDVSAQTFYSWLNKHPRFLEEHKRGKEEADAHVAHSLYHRALGYSHPAVKIFMHEGEPVYADFVEHYPPDTKAAQVWLGNRRRKAENVKWVDRQEVSGPDGGPIEMNVLHENLAERIARIAAGKRAPILSGEPEPAGDESA